MDNKLDLMIEAEKRGILPPDKVALLNEARSRGLIQSNKPVIQDQPQPNTGVGRTIFDQSLQGATSGFSDEAIAPLAALYATAKEDPQALITGEFKSPELAQQIATAPQQVAQDLKAQQEAHPIVAPLSQAGGFIASSIPFSGTKIGGAVGNLSRTGLLPQATSLAGRAANLFSKSLVSGATAATGGALYGAGTSEQGNRGEGAKQGAILAGSIGAALPVVGAGISATGTALTPKIDEGLQAVAELAQRYKIPLSVDQLTTSKPVKTFQKISQEMPFSGVGDFRQQQMNSFNQALTKTIGVNSSKITPEVMDMAFKKVGSQFDSLGKGKTFPITDAFKNQIDEIMQDAQITAKKDAIDNFNKGLERVYLNMNKDGTISGERLSLLRQQMNKLSRKASDPDTQELLKDLEGAIVDLMTEGDDVAKGVLSNAKQQYKNLIVLEPIAQKAQGGNINPTLLANRVAKVYGRQYTTGKSGEIGDLARIGKELLPQLGGSDTAQKAAMLSTIGVGGVFEPVTTAIVAGSTVAGNKAIQKSLLQNQSLVNKIIEKGKNSQLSIENKQPLRITVRPSDRNK